MRARRAPWGKVLGLDAGDAAANGHISGRRVSTRRRTGERNHRESYEVSMKAHRRANCAAVKLCPSCMAPPLPHRFRNGIRLTRFGREAQQQFPQKSGMPSRQAGLLCRALKESETSRNGPQEE